MNITVNIDEISLASMVAKLVAEQDGPYNRLRQRIETIRDEEIRARVAPLVAEAIANPVATTNNYGEPTGKSVPLRELIVGQAHKTLNERGDYGRGKSMLEAAIEKAVKEAFLGEIAAEVAKVRDAVTKDLGAQAAQAITATVQNALAGRR